VSLSRRLLTNRSRALTTGGAGAPFINRDSLAAARRPDGASASFPSLLRASSSKTISVAPAPVARIAVLMAAGAVALPAQVVDRKALMIALEDFTPLQGGVPIVVAGQIVGAIGVSGASSADQDQQFAQAGAAAIK